MSLLDTLTHSLDCTSFSMLQAASASVEPSQCRAPSTSGHRTHQTVVVMRHGRRIDTDNPTWHTTAQWSWDPPLSDFGVKDIDKPAGRVLPIAHYQILVCSPFTRCLQTACRVLAYLAQHQPPDSVRQPTQIIIDKRLCEVFAPQLLHKTLNPSCWAQLKRMWWQSRWQRCSKYALKQLQQQSQLPIIFASHPWPQFPELLTQASARFRATVASYADLYPDKNVLVISHGNAVESAVHLADPSSRVLQVHFGGFAVLKRLLASECAVSKPWELDPITPCWGVEMTRNAVGGGGYMNTR